MSAKSIQVDRGSKQVLLRQVRGLTASGRPVLIGDEPLKLGIPNEHDGPLDLAVRAAPDAEQRLTGRVGRASGMHEVDLGTYTEGEAWPSRVPLVMHLAAIRGLDEEKWRSWVERVREVVEQFVNSVTTPRTARDGVLQTLASNLAIEWHVLPLDVLRYRLLVATTIGEADTLTVQAPPAREFVPGDSPDVPGWLVEGVSPPNPRSSGDRPLILGAP